MYLLSYRHIIHPRQMFLRQKKALGLPAPCQPRLLWKVRLHGIKLWCLLSSSHAKPSGLLAMDKTVSNALRQCIGTFPPLVLNLKTCFLPHEVTLIWLAMHGHALCLLSSRSSLVEDKKTGLHSCLTEARLSWGVISGPKTG